MQAGRGGDGQEGESGKLTDPYAKRTRENDECLYRDAHSHLSPPTPAAHGTCGRQAGRGAQHRGRGRTMMRRAAHMHVGTLFPDTHREARKRGSQAHIRKRHTQSEPGRQK